MKRRKLRVGLDFAGIGVPIVGLRRALGPRKVKVVLKTASEIDKKCQKVLTLMLGAERMHGDIRQRTDDSDLDVLVIAAPGRDFRVKTATQPAVRH